MNERDTFACLTQIRQAHGVVCQLFHAKNLDLAEYAWARRKSLGEFLEHKKQTSRSKYVQVNYTTTPWVQHTRVTQLFFFPMMLRYPNGHSFAKNK
jgi:hypothetical protein